jgi:ketosteroid isomerase-like protein
MARIIFAVFVCLGFASLSAHAAGPQGMDTVMRHYDASAVAEGKIQVSASGDVAYVSGTSPDGPWMAVWRRTDGQWKIVAELVSTPLKPIRFGAKRERPRCQS